MPANDALTKLKEKAEKATPGPWRYESEANPSARVEPSICFPIWQDGQNTPEHCDANGAFIAAANPAVVLALVREVQAWRATNHAKNAMNLNARRD